MMVKSSPAPGSILVLATFLFCFITGFVAQQWPASGYFPANLNLATHSQITVNASCGESESEIFCKLVEHSANRQPQCDICDARSIDPAKRHFIRYAVDGSTKWWQSPSLQYGSQYEWVTITLDLKQIYQVAYVILKSANSPRPGNWILERSVDGKVYKPWQYYAVNDAECLNTYKMEPKKGRPRYSTDNEVICTSYYSKLEPMENGEIHTTLIVGRPGAKVRSRLLEDFTRARYVRLRMQKVLTLNADLMLFNNAIDSSVSRRSRRDLNKYFYSIKDISIGGACVCNGHAVDCPINKQTGAFKCNCLHNTCGTTCNKCCPLYNQKLWRSGTVEDGSMCEKCECHGHARSCKYDEEISSRKLSMNAFKEYNGGGVCIACQHNTMGTNCEQCKDGFYRPQGVARESKNPCRRCNCQSSGSIGECVKDDSRVFEGILPGSCICKSNFAGKDCDRCAEGYEGYPECRRCTCHHAGTKNWNCGLRACSCKDNVKGRRCDQCKASSYYLNPENPDGCTKCFCFGATDKCNSSEISAVTVKQTAGWLVTDLSGKKKIRSTLEGSTSRIAQDEVTWYDKYYWQAPKDYLGQKIHSYGGKLKFVMGYAKNRGDTSGVFIEGMNVILEGRGMRIGYNGKAVRPDVDNTVVIPLWEHGWFKLNSRGEKISPITKADMMAVLYDVDRLLLRANYHTDQIEGILNEVAVDVGSSYAVSKKKMKLVERCDCPPGYAGLSCQHCLPGYRKLKVSMYSSQCVMCDCNGHAERCDTDTGACINCLHNTVGNRCGVCEEGYYGDATRGTPNDCKPCACPLREPNNFSDKCTAVPSAIGNTILGYICSNCEKGYTGDKCQRCSDGFFGNPLAPGNYCQSCDCSENVDPLDVGICDTNSGKCLKCLGNTTGWKCELCKSGFYGNALEHNCRACDCNSYGSVSPNCDINTGKCVCRPNFVGDKCDRCAVGYGSISEGCRPCNCNPVGSRTRNCDPKSGICECKPGVFGTKCDSCLDGYYGFSDQGCQWCGCDPDGSNSSSSCNQVTGQCVCKSLVVGRACDRCTTGFWSLRSETGCKKCDCNTTGSISLQCDDSSGKCQCKPGVNGDKCDRCLPGYFGWSFRGCRKCARCDQAGHLCDPQTGECVCPPNTTGDRCQYCKPQTYGYDRLRGCKICDCNSRGSVGERCDPRTGKCRCLQGVEGEKCDRCQYGFYNFPHCVRCNCNQDGTVLNECRSPSLCHCDDQGQCPCKVHTMSRDCGQCKPMTYSLTKKYDNGCFGCFCYGKPVSCSQGHFIWTQIILPAGRRADMDQIRSRTLFNVTNGLKTIPEQTGNIRMGISALLDGPLYWSLPRTFLGDKSLSYNGIVRFKVTSYGRRKFSDSSLTKFPLIQIQGNWRLILEYHANETANGVYEVHLREDFWKLRGNPHMVVTRPIMMVMLQNLQHFLIRATTFADPQQALIEDVTLQHGQPRPSQSNSGSAVGLEMCQCPRQYVGASCQDPARGYYRKRKDDFLNSKDIIDLVGVAVPCDCNGRSDGCDRETGICYNCHNNTTGSNCELCSVGFYGNPNVRPCRPCACPLVSNSFSDTCVQDGADYYCTNCKPGYTGRYCHRCANGYYGDPGVLGGRCVPCACDQQGSTSALCDQRTGQCNCKEGITGRDCTICKPRYVITKNGCKSCDDDCAGVLLKDIDYFMNILNNTHISGLVPAPWQKLLQYENRTNIFRTYLQEYMEALRRGQQLVKNFNYDFDLESLANLLLLNARETGGKSPQISSSAKKVYDDSLIVLKEMENLMRYILDVINNLNQYGLDSLGPALSIARALEEAERILYEIKARNFVPNKDEAERELRKARDLLERMKTLMFDHNKLDVLKSKLSKLRELIQDLIYQMTEKVKKPTEEALGILRNSQRIISRTEAAYNQAVNISDITEQVLRTGESLIEDAKRLLEDARLNFQALPTMYKNLVTITRRLRKEVNTLARINPIYRRRYVIPAQQHAANLMRQAAMLANLFKATQDLTEYPLRAAMVYGTIVDALIDAMAAARNASAAAENAYKKAFPDSGDSLVDFASRLKAKSRQLLETAKRLRDREIPGLQSMLSEQIGTIDMTERMVVKGKLELAYLNRVLDNLPIGTTQALLNAIDDAELAAEYGAEANNRTVVLQKKIIDELYPKLQQIQAGSSAGLGNISLIIDKARQDIRASVKEVTNLVRYKEKINNIGDGIRLNLDILRRKIKQARQTASTIQVSLSNNNESKCVRSYRPRIQPSTSNHVVMTYGINSTNEQDALLFYIGNKDKKDFMALEMVNRKIQFSWNTGGKLNGKIVHNLTLLTNDRSFSANSKWYKIEILRFGNQASLSVQPSPEAALKDSNMVSGTSSPGFSMIDLDGSSDFFIGGVPNNMWVPTEIHANTYSGCMFQLKIDGNNVGLWEFKTNEGCGGCKEGPLEETDFSSLSFKGDGYLSLPQITDYQPRSYSIALNFKTYYENALLFFSPNINTGEYISIELRNGHIVYQFKIGTQTKLIQQTKQKYNTGTWTKVIAERSGLQGLLSVQNELLEGRITSGASTLDLKNGKLYFGGVPPTFNTSAGAWEAVGFNSFLGCMKGLQMDTTPLGIFRSQSFKVSPGCRQQMIRIVGFKGTGFVEVNSRSLQRNTDFGFMFRTSQLDALLMLSTFVTQRASTEQLKNYYSVALINGKIEARFNDGSGQQVMKSNIVLNDNMYHAINFVKTGRRIVCHINDQPAMSIQLRGDTVEVPSVGGLFFGGVPPEILADEMAASDAHFTGTIKDAVFNRELISFGSPKRFMKVGIGRQEGAIFTKVSTSTYTSSSIEQCAETSTYSWESSAVRFGDSPNSQIQKIVNRKNISTDFKISFDFRTFYSNGLLMHLRNENRRTYLMVHLKDGKIYFDLKNKNTRQLAIDGNHANGEWQTISLEKVNRRVKVKVGSSDLSQIKVRKKLYLLPTFYFGSIPSTFSEAKIIPTETFKGCIRRFTLNNQPIDLASGIVTTIGQCFSLIERGAYFGGDAHATYVNSFVVGSQMEMMLEFRTTKLNGVLISVSTVINSPSFSIELNGGNVSVNADMGFVLGKFSLTKSFSSKYSLCDGMWHNVKATYNSRSLTLQVDGQTETHSFTDFSNVAISTRSPLYIGGLPERAATGALSTKDNFIGCLKNVIINSAQVEWTNMVGLNNVIPNSCPL